MDWKRIHGNIQVGSSSSEEEFIPGEDWDFSTMRGSRPLPPVPESTSNSKNLSSISQDILLKPAKSRLLHSNINLDIENQEKVAGEAWVGDSGWQAWGGLGATLKRANEDSAPDINTMKGAFDSLNDSDSDESLSKELQRIDFEDGLSGVKRELATTLELLQGLCL